LKWGISDDTIARIELDLWKTHQVVGGRLMNEVLDMINSIIEEHRQIVQSINGTEQIVNDFGAIVEVKKTTDVYEPASTEPEKRSLERFRESLKMVSEGLNAHFNREETSLLKAFEEHGGEVLASALHVLLNEHEEIRNRLTKLERDTAELAEEKSSVHVWHGKAYGIRTYFVHTRALVEAHAKSEQELFQALEAKLAQE